MADDIIVPFVNRVLVRRKAEKENDKNETRLSIKNNGVRLGWHAYGRA